MLRLDRRKRTDPSPNRTFAPPVWNAKVSPVPLLPNTGSGNVAPTSLPLVQLRAHGPGNVVPSGLEPFRSKSEAARAQPPPLTRTGGLPLGSPCATRLRKTVGRPALSATRMV